MKRKLLGLALALAVSVVPSFAHAEEYIMSSGDELNITILKHPDLSTNTTGKNYIVRPDGFVSFPLIGNVDTKGKTVEAFRQEITERFSEYLVKPDITVNIAKLGSTRVFVFGEVKMQGSHELTKSHRVLDALGAAKGFNLEAAKGRVYLIRANDMKAFAKQNANKQETKESVDKALPSNVTKVNLNEYFRKGDLAQNPVLNEGDCIFIARNHRVDLRDLIVRAAQTAYYINDIND